MHRSMISLVMRGGLVLLVSLTLTHKTHAGTGPTVGAVGVTSSTVRVINAHDAGPGSFRQAILDANTHPSIHRIVFATRVGTVALPQPVEYTGTQALSIEGNRTTLDGAGLPAGASGFLASGGGNLTVTGLTIRGAPGVGLTVAVPGSAIGTIEGLADQFRRARQRVAWGVDQRSGRIFQRSQLDLGGRLRRRRSTWWLSAVTSSNNGFTALDQDGMRINEGGIGTLKARESCTQVEGNGGDGVELDERDVGGRRVQRLWEPPCIGNGSFTAGRLRRWHRYRRSPATGSIIGTFFLTSANENFEQGFDLNENGAGDLRVDMLLVEASGNDGKRVSSTRRTTTLPAAATSSRSLVGIKTRANGAATGTRA